jgi:hypothetical protein
MKPGPAISMAATSPPLSAARTASTIPCASSRGGLPAALASTMAAFTAKSPCFGSRGGSTANASAAGQRPWASSATWRWFTALAEMTARRSRYSVET